MQPSTSLNASPCEIPAECYNHLSRLRRDSGGYLDFGLPGLEGNFLILRGHHWQLWNRRLNKLLLSWQDFRNGERQRLADPVQCTLTVHHSYSRTVIHRVYASIWTFCTRPTLSPSLPANPPLARVLALPGGKSPEHD